MMSDNQFNSNYMDFINRIGVTADITYHRISTLSQYNEVKQDKHDALIDAVFDIADMAYNDGSDFYMQSAIEHAEYMYSVYSNSTNYHDAEYYKYYARHMKKYHDIYLMCMTY